MAREDEQAGDRERPDDLGSRMEAGFALLHGRIDRLDSETKADLRHLDAKIDAKFHHLDGKLNALIAAMIVGVLTLIGTGITAIVGI